MEPFADAYNDALGEIEEDERRRGRPPRSRFPNRPTSRRSPTRKGWPTTRARSLDREQADHYGQVGEAEVGANAFSGGKRFAAEVFQPKSSLFEPIELTDSRKNHFLVRKVQDLTPRVPALDEIHAEVAHAWKLAQARPLAEKAAQELAEKVKKDGGKFKGETVEDTP